MRATINRRNGKLTSDGRQMNAVYRVLYDGVLSRLPEERAIALGQTFLRLFPLDRLPGVRLDDPRLAVTLGGVRLPNPLILAAQYYDTTILRRAMGLGFGAVTAKSITRYPRPGHPEPNLVRVRTAAGPGLINCNGFKNPGLDAFARDVARLPHRVPLIVSVAGESPEDCVELVRRLGRTAISSSSTSRRRTRSSCTRGASARPSSRRCWRRCAPRRRAR